VKSVVSILILLFDVVRSVMHSYSAASTCGTNPPGIGVFDFAARCDRTWFFDYDIVVDDGTSITISAASTVDRIIVKRGTLLIDAPLHSKIYGTT